MRNKLKNKQGVTIFMALLFLLAAVMVSCVILAAAVTALKTTQQERAQQQAYLTVSSAAERMIQEIKQAEIAKGTVSWINRKDSSQGEYPILEYPKEDDTPLYAVWKYLATALETQNTATREFQIQVDGLETVNVKITMDRSYDIIAEVYSGMSRVVLEANADPFGTSTSGESVDNPDIWETGFVTTYRWNTVTVRKEVAE